MKSFSLGDLIFCRLLYFTQHKVIECMQQESVVNRASHSEKDEG